MAGEDDSSHSECETSQQQDMETEDKPEPAAENKVRDGMMTQTSEQIKYDCLNKEQMVKSSMSIFLH